jgi:hypothetical protein
MSTEYTASATAGINNNLHRVANKHARHLILRSISEFAKNLHIPALAHGRVSRASNAFRVTAVVFQEVRAVLHSAYVEVVAGTGEMVWWWESRAKVW